MHTCVGLPLVFSLRTQSAWQVSILAPEGWSGQSQLVVEWQTSHIHTQDTFFAPAGRTRQIKRSFAFGDNTYRAFTLHPAFDPAVHRHVWYETNPIPNQLLLRLTLFSLKLPTLSAPYVTHSPRRSTHICAHKLLDHLVLCICGHQKRDFCVFSLNLPSPSKNKSSPSFLMTATASIFLVTDVVHWFSSLFFFSFPRSTNFQF